MKRHLKHRFLLFVIALVFIFLLLLIVYSIYSFLYRPKENKPDNTNKDNVKESTISLIMAGDALIHKTIYEDVKISDNSYNFKSIFTYIKPIVKDYGLAFYNQETILGGTSLGLGKYPLFNTPQEFGDAMIDAGFNIVSQANNHSLDKGEEGIISSINYWSNKYVLTAGTYSSFNDM
jgi:poly-gamma-glutamate synthesis protein (capsule biosynthesis protein)